MVRRRLSGRCRTAYHFRVKAGIILEAALTAATARSVCGSSPRNGYFRGYHTNTARGESKTPISRNRGEIGGSVREHVPKEPRERTRKIGSEQGLWFDRREWRDVPIIETPAHNPKVVGSNPAPATTFSQVNHVIGWPVLLSGTAKIGFGTPLGHEFGFLPHFVCRRGGFASTQHPAIDCLCDSQAHP